MTVQNIPHEMFSSFSARFEEVRKVQVEYFLLHWGAIRSSDAMASIWQQIRGGKHPGFEEGKIVVVSCRTMLIHLDLLQSGLVSL
jgi:hypothetical protein